MTGARRADRYEASGSAATGIFMLLFGLALTAFCGSLGVDAILDLRAYPDAPRPMTVAEAAALAAPPRGTWVRIVDGHIDCRFPPRPGDSGSDVYTFLTDASGVPRLLLALEDIPPGACDEHMGAPWTGVLHASTPGRIVGLEFPGVDWRTWPTPHLTVLWTHLGPSDSRTGAWLFPLLTLPGLLMAFAGLTSIREARSARRAPARSLEGAAFRMPLSTGGSAMTLFGAPFLVIQLVVFGPLFVAKHLPEWTVIPVGVLWAAWFFMVIGGLIDGWRRRASDLLLGREELAIVAGPLHGTCIAFRDVDRASFVLARAQPANDEPADGAEGSPAPTAIDERARLVLDGETAAMTRDADEERSLAAVVDTIVALGAQARGERQPLRAKAPPGIVACPACGAPVAPAARDEVPCGHCGAPVPMPAPVREQLAAEERVGRARSETDRMLKRLLRQPGARATNALMAIAIPPLLVGFPLASILFDEMFQIQKRFAWQHGVSLFVFAVSFTYGLSWLLRAQVAARAAVRLVATRFAAVPPAAPGEPCSCHRCGAPLPVASAEQLVAACVYCRAESVLGTNLLPIAAMEGAQSADLAAELRARLAERHRYALVSLGSLVLLALSAASLVPVIRTLREGTPSHASSGP